MNYLVNSRITNPYGVHSITNDFIIIYRFIRDDDGNITCLMKKNEPINSLLAKTIDNQFVKLVNENCCSIQYKAS